MPEILHTFMSFDAYVVCTKYMHESRWFNTAMRTRTDNACMHQHQVLSDSLTSQPEAPSTLPEPSPKVQHWRERAYVAGFLKDAHVAAWRLQAQLMHSASMFKAAETQYNKLIATLQEATSASKRAELPLGEALWAAAKLYRYPHENAHANLPCIPTQGM